MFLWVALCQTAKEIRWVTGYKNIFLNPLMVGNWAPEPSVLEPMTSPRGTESRWSFESHKHFPAFVGNGMYPVCVCVCACPVTTRVWLCSLINYSSTGSSIHGNFQARILEWVVISFSRGSSWPRNWTCISFIGRQIPYHWATWEADVPYKSLISGVAFFCNESSRILTDLNVHNEWICILTKISSLLQNVERRELRRESVHRRWRSFL